MTCAAGDIIAAVVVVAVVAFVIVRLRELSRPTSCVIDADIDAEDQAESDPQKGQ